MQPPFQWAPFFSPRVCSRQVIKLATYLHLERGLSMSGAVPPRFLYVFMTWIGTTLPLHL